MEMLKTVTEPIAQVAMMSQVRGFLDEYEGVDSDVLFTEGEIHSNMKPVSLLALCPSEAVDVLSNIFGLIGLSPFPYGLCPHTIRLSRYDRYPT
jgi:hypothetical protein